MKYKTNIKCDACVAKVTPYLNDELGEGKWKVDLKDPQRTLTTDVETSEVKLNDALKKAGYKAEAVK